MKNQTRFCFLLSTFSCKIKKCFFLFYYIKIWYKMTETCWFVWISYAFKFNETVAHVSFLDTFFVSLIIRVTLWYFVTIKKSCKLVEDHSSCVNNLVMSDNCGNVDIVKLNIFIHVWRKFKTVYVSFKMCLSLRL